MASSSLKRTSDRRFSPTLIYCRRLNKQINELPQDRRPNVYAPDQTRPSNQRQSEGFEKPEGPVKYVFSYRRRAR